MADETTPNNFDADIKKAAKLYNLEEAELQKAVKAELLALVAKKIVEPIKEQLEKGDYPAAAVW